MRCAICDYENPEYAVVCEHCGCFLAKDKLPPEKRRSSILDPLGEKRIRCAYCWHSNPAGVEKCERCGMTLSHVPYPEREGYGEEFVEREGAEHETGERVYSERGEAGDAARHVEENRGYPERGEENRGYPERGEENRGIEETSEKPSEVDRAITAELEKPDTNPVPEGMIRCRNCWRDNPIIQTYCQYCDQKLDRPKRKPGSEENEPDNNDEVVICGVCGRKNKADEIRCFHCGSKLPNRYHDDLSIFGNYPEEHDEFDGLFSGTVEAFYKARALDQMEERRKRDEEREKIERSKKSGSVNYSVPGKKRCRSCWYDNPQWAERCQKCGAPLSKAQAGRKKPVPVEYECTCGYENAPDATVCAKCGGVVMKTCPSCGHANSPKLSFCAKCGVRIAPRKNKLTE